VLLFGELKGTDYPQIIGLSRWGLTNLLDVVVAPHLLMEWNIFSIILF